MYSSSTSATSTNLNLFSTTPVPTGHANFAGPWARHIASPGQQWPPSTREVLPLIKHDGWVVGGWVRARRGGRWTGNGGRKLRPATRSRVVDSGNVRRLILYPHAHGARAPYCSRHGDAMTCVRA